MPLPRKIANAILSQNFTIHRTATLMDLYSTVLNCAVRRLENFYFLEIEFGNRSYLHILQGISFLVHDQNVLQFGKFEFFFSFKLLHSFEVVKTTDICFILSVKLKKKKKKNQKKNSQKKKKKSRAFIFE